jgi:hypothetical protein
MPGPELRRMLAADCPRTIEGKELLMRGGERLANSPEFRT